MSDASVEARIAPKGSNKMVVRVLGPLLWLLAVAFTPAPAYALPIAFDFVFVDEPGDGFNDPVFGQQARDALVAAGQIWGQQFESSFPGETITARARFENSGGGGLGLATVLQFAFPSPPPVLAANTFYPAPLINHLTGADFLPPGAPPSGEGAEMSLIFTSDANFFFGIDGGPASDQFDFITLALHEIGHGLGFANTASSDGSFTDGFPGIYDRFVVDEFGVPITSMTDAERLAATTQRGGVFWSGNNGVAGNGGNPPFLFAVDGEFLRGTSLGHLDAELIGRTDLVMATSLGREPALGRSARVPDSIALGMFADIGWRTTAVTAVPEPPTILLLLAGLVGVIASPLPLTNS